MTQLRRRTRGFTLVELMVAISGGLILAVIVFMVARDGSRFYQRESRVANATMSVLNGFQRLRVDIARAGYLSSPNIRKDPHFCGEISAANGWTASTLRLNELAAVRIETGGSGTNVDVSAFRAANSLEPDRIILAGAYSSVEQFPVAEMSQRSEDGGSVFRIVLQANSESLGRLGFIGADDDTQQDILESVFKPDGADRALRIVTTTGAEFYGVIADVGFELNDEGKRVPHVDLTNDITPQKATGNVCGYAGFGRGALVNVVNFIQYDVRPLRTNANYAVVYENEVLDTFDHHRSELVRVELDVAGDPIASTEELIAEFAVDLKFGLTVLNPGGGPSMLNIGEQPPGTAADNPLSQFAGDPSPGGVAAGINQGPHLIRAVHARLAVRSREGDRLEDIDPISQNIPAGLYRVALGPTGEPPFARVRTLQADIAIRNNEGARWP